jgi:hypothetical protein
MKTVTDQLREMAEEIKANVVDLLRNHSGIECIPVDPHSPVVLTGADHFWNPLKTTAVQLQGKVRRQYGKLIAVLRALCKSNTASIEGALEEPAQTIYEIMDQDRRTCIKTIEEAVTTFEKAIEGQIRLLSCLYDAAEGTCIFVPDTNALLYNPSLEDWEFDTCPQFTVILLPTILSELDQLKVNHRNDNVRQKAEGLIRRIKGYRSRGRLAEGVTLCRGRSNVTTIAVEPTMADSLPWLQADNNDDRMLAGFIEVMREHPRCQVVLVTRDVNLQNKAEYAGLPFVEPPEPPTTTGA